MSEREPHVFISYHRADLAVAERVRAHLTTHRVATWMDRYDIPAGAYWPDEIDKGLSRAGLVVGLLSPEAVESRNVKNEWDWALQNGKNLILLMVRSCVVPHRYVSINFIDATGKDMDAALETLTRTPGVRPAQPTPPVPRTRYALSGDLSVAYQVFGDGPLDLVYVPGYISHVEHHWKFPAHAAHLARFGSLARVIKFDKRGTGLSDRTSGIATLEERMDDIRAVMDGAGSDRAVLFGLSEGVPLSVLFAATYPDRTRGLVLYGGQATYVRQPDYPWGTPREARRREIDERASTLFARWGTVDLARETVRHFAPSAENDDAFVTWLAEYMRLAASPGAEIARARMNLEVDVRSILPAIRVPTLVVNRVGDRDAKIGEARYLAERIPGATLVELPGDDHFPSVGDQESFFAAIEPFIASLGDRATENPDQESVLATVVCLSVAGRDLDPNDEGVSRELRHFRGRLMTAAGGRTVAVFDGPARAIRFANAVAGSGCGGIQTGEVLLDDTAVGGMPVEVVTRLADVATPGQLLATGTVRDLVAGSGILFLDAPDEQATGGADGPRVLIIDRTSLG